MKAMIFAAVLAGAPALVHAQQETVPSFEVASIKPAPVGARQGIAIQPGGRFVANGVSVRLLIALAWHLQAYQLAGGESWVDNDKWSIEATAGHALDGMGATELPDAIAVRLRSLLLDRFGLKTHSEMRERQIYTLNVGKGGFKLTPADASAHESVRAGPGRLIALAITMNQLVTLLNRTLDRPVVDRTGLTGRYDMKLEFAPEGAPGSVPGVADSGGQVDPSIFTAVQEQLGLKLESTQEAVETLVIDSVHPPTAN